MAEELVEDFTPEEMADYVVYVEKVENVMVVLDDMLEIGTTLEDRLLVIEAVANALGVEADCMQLWQHVNGQIKEQGTLQ